MKRTLEIGDRDITIVGTAHVSEESRSEVREVIEDQNPDLVCVELDENRYDSLRNDSGWSDLEVPEAIKNGDGKLLLLNLILSIYQRRLGLQEGMKPGQELLEAIDVAEENDIDFALVDQDINETLSRAMNALSFWDKALLIASLFASEEEDEIDVESLKESDMLTAIVKELEEELPELKRVFLDERNTFMAEKILEKDFESAVVVVGAAHAEGLEEELKKEKRDIEFPDHSGFPWMKAVSYGFPLFVLAGLGYSFYQIGFSAGVDVTGKWIIFNAVFSFIGAIIARSHVTTWFVSALSAPLTSVYPALGAGMVASYYEAKINPPTVEELENITKVEKYRELWSNQMGRILLTLAFVTIGSLIGSVLGAGYIFSVIGL
jgi:pheromone shutdown-related protein TraB